MNNSAHDYAEPTEREPSQTRTAAADAYTQQPMAMCAPPAVIPINPSYNLQCPATNNVKAIIYIDDEAALVFLVTRILERRGYSVVGFTDPIIALVEIEKNSTRIDAVISDISMPAMNGIEVARKVLELRGDLPVLLVSSEVRPQDAALAQQLGVRQVIHKLAVFEELALALQEVFADRLN